MSYTSYAFTPNAPPLPPAILAERQSDLENAMLICVWTLWNVLDYHHVDIEACSVRREKWILNQFTPRSACLMTHPP